MKRGTESGRREPDALKRPPETGLLGQRHEQLRQPLNVVDDGGLAAEDASDALVGLGIEPDAVGEDAVLVEFLDGLAGILDEQAPVASWVSTSGHLSSVRMSISFLPAERVEVVRGVARRGAHAGGVARFLRSQPYFHFVVGVSAAAPDVEVAHVVRGVGMETRNGKRVAEFFNGPRQQRDRFLERFFAAGELEIQSSMKMRSNRALKQARRCRPAWGQASSRCRRWKLNWRSNGLAVLNVDGFPIMRHGSIVHRSDKRLSPAAQAFKEFVPGAAEDTSWH